MKDTRIHHVLAGLRALDDITTSTKYKQRIATAADPGAITKKMEAMRQQFKEQALQVSYESKQRLAGILREMQHVLTDLIHAMNVNGEDSTAMRKLQDQAGKITRSMSFVGEDDANGDGIKDSIKDSIGLNINQSKNTGGEDSGEDDSEDPNQAFRDAVKSIAPKKEAPTKDPKEEPAKPKVKEDAEDADDTEDDVDSEEDAGDEESKSNKPDAKKAKLLKKKLAKPAKTEDKKSDDSGDTKKEGGLVQSLLAESSFQAVAGMRFVYLGTKNVKKNGESVTVLLAGFGTHDNDSLRVYYYKPTSKFFKGDAVKIDKLFRKILESEGGYAKLSSELNARVKTNHLEIIARKEKQASEILDTDGSWSYRGVAQHPKNPEKKAIWFEIGTSEFAALPSKNFESGDVVEADSYIQVNLIGSKKHGGVGKPYSDGLAALENLVSSGKLKIIFHAKIK